MSTELGLENVRRTLMLGDKRQLMAMNQARDWYYAYGDDPMIAIGLPRYGEGGDGNGEDGAEDVRRHSRKRPRRP